MKNITMRIKNNVLYSFLIFLLILSLPTDSFCQTNKKRFSPRIVGGVEAPRGAYPFMAALYTKESFCGAALIHPRWVLTAAHCLQENYKVENPADLSVYTGIHDLQSDYGTPLKVQRIIIHPQYNESSLNNDIALLELTSPSTNGTPIEINRDKSNSLAGQIARTIGWGDTTEGGSMSDKLLQIDLNVVSNQTCSQTNGSTALAGMICAGAPGKDSCQGDSGGPMFIGNKHIGVTSFGFGCAAPNTYGVYARTSHYVEWIDQYVPPARPATPLAPANGDFGLWNSFLGMVNIAELRNDSNAAVTAQVNISDITGKLLSTDYFYIEAGQQHDVILNDLLGFSPESYGLVQISNNISSQITYYRPKGTAFSDFDFAYTIPFSGPTRGTSYVSFNTNHPGITYAQVDNLVANWLAIVNLDTVSRNFTVYKYNESGQLIGTTPLTLQAGNRTDLDGGHVNPGKRRYGYIEIVPQNANAPYLSQLIRYGYSYDGTSLDFAFPLVASAPLAGKHILPVDSTTDRSFNWIELLNPENSTQKATVTLYNSLGVPLRSNEVVLEQRGQAHIYIPETLTNSNPTYAEISPSGSGKLISQSMFYYLDPHASYLTTISGIQAQNTNRTPKSGSYNTFLDMSSELVIHNTSSASATFKITLQSQGLPAITRDITIAKNSSISQQLRNAPFSIQGNIYGTVTVEPKTPTTATFNAYVIRTRRNIDNSAQYIIPTMLVNK